MYMGQETTLMMEHEALQLLVIHLILHNILHQDLEWILTTK